MIAHITRTLNTGRFVRLLGTIFFSLFRATYVLYSQGALLYGEILPLLSVHVLYSQGTLLYGLIFYGKLFARHTRAFTSRFVPRAQYLPVKQPDFLPVTQTRD